MVSLEDPCTVAKNLIDENWSTDTGGTKPGLHLRRESNTLGPTPATGDIWFYEQSDEPTTADIFHNNEDNRITFGVEIRGNTYSRMATIWAEVERIRRAKQSDPGSDLSTPDTTFHFWKRLPGNVGWEGKGNFRRTLNYEMQRYDISV